MEINEKKILKKFATYKMEILKKAQRYIVKYVQKYF